MNDRQRRLYERIKNRYDAYLQDNVKHDLLMFILRDEEKNILAEMGLGKISILMRADVPAVLKKFEKLQAKPEEIFLFKEG